MQAVSFLERPANKSQVEISEILQCKMGAPIQAALRLFFETAASQQSMYGITLFLKRRDKP